MLPNIPGLKQKMQKMQDDMQRLQTQLDEDRLETSSGGGAVKVLTTGKGALLEIKLSPEVVDPSDIEMLQDLIVSAVNEAQNKAEEHRTVKMNAVTGGIMGSLPPGLF